MLIENRVIRHGHLYCGLGGGAKGFNQGEARIGNLRAHFKCIGGIDVDAAAVRDFERLSGAKGTVMDLFSRDQYTAFHGHEPPADWREAVPSDIVRAFNNERPNIIFLSAPCKGFSGLLSDAKSQSPRYQALNELAIRGLMLALEAYQEDPVELFVFENVVRLAARGRGMLDQIEQLFRAYGYASRETSHDCGELGGLAQSRKRFLLVARHMEKVPAALYTPNKRPLRAVGDVLGRMPLPGDVSGGPMHRIPRLHWRTWVRLAFVEAGSDWRSLRKLRIENGMLADFALAREFGAQSLHAMADPRFSAGSFASTQFGVTAWTEPSHTLTSQRSPGQGKFSIADIRVDGHHKSVQMGVRRWDETTGVVTGKMFAGTGPCSIADPRIDGVRHNNVFRIVRWSDVSPAVTGGTGPTAGALNVADPRTGVIHGRREAFKNATHYGVVRRDDRAAIEHATQSVDALPAPKESVVAVIRSLDESWHRPFTTLELAALQGLVDPEEYLELDGLSDTAWRERIGNAVPPPAAAAVASEMGRTLLLASTGETFVLSATPVWVRNIAVALSVAGEVRQ